MIKDLHIHTKYSDGEDDEYQIIEKIKEKKIQEFAITDHDTIEGSKKVCELVNSDKNLVFHSGVELTCRIKEINQGINVHLLYYDFDYQDLNLIKIIEEISKLRLKKVNLMKEFVEKTYKIKISNKEIQELILKTKSVGKPHFYALLCKYGDYDREEYYHYMNKLRSEHLKLDAIKVLEIAKKSKGYVSLAHPREIMEEYNLDYKEIEKIVAYLKEKGLGALETRHSKHDSSDYQAFSTIAKKYNLIETCGSDYHGASVKPDVILGCCKK